MRRLDSFDELIQQIEYFIDTLADYKADFAVLPELFNVPLMGQFPLDTPTAEAMRMLASEYTAPICEECPDGRALQHQYYCGEPAQLEEGEMYNVSYLFRRDGTQDCQYKTAYYADDGTPALECERR